MKTPEVGTIVRVLPPFAISFPGEHAVNESRPRWRKAQTRTRPGLG